MAIAISGIISVTVIIVALVMSAAYITTHQKKERPKRRATQEDIDQFFENYECCTKVINWIPIEDLEPEIGARVLATIKWVGEEEPDDEVYEVTRISANNYGITGEVIAWARLPEPYKKPRRC